MMTWTESVVAQNLIWRMEIIMGPEFVKEVSYLPGAMRKQMMKDRMDQLVALPEEGRQEAIRGLVVGFLDPKIKEEHPRRASKKSLSPLARKSSASSPRTGAAPL